jgi:glycosyltransferase involved in cell wall biosynthesis
MLAVTLERALSQEGVDHEVIVVDDGSTDGTSERLRRLDEPRLVLVRNDRPQGVAQARNRGIAAARGRWIAFLDDDDYWAPRKLRLQLDAAAQGDPVLVYCESLLVDDRLRAMGSIVPPPPSRIADELQAWNLIGGPSVVMVDAAAVRRLGGFDERLSVLADWDLWIRLADAGPTACQPAVLVAYVIHDEGMFTRSPAQAMLDFRYVAAKHAARGARLGIAASSPHMLMALAHGHARAGRRRAAFVCAVRAAFIGRRVRYAALGVAFLADHRRALAVRRLFVSAPPRPPDWMSDARPPPRDATPRRADVRRRAADAVKMNVR